MPVAIQHYLCDLLELPQSLVPTMSALRTVRRHRREIRAFLGLRPYGQGGQAVVDAAVQQSVATPTIRLVISVKIIGTTATVTRTATM